MFKLHYINIYLYIINNYYLCTMLFDKFFNIIFDLNEQTTNQTKFCQWSAVVLEIIIRNN